MTAIGLTVLVAAAAYRGWRLTGHDIIMRPVRARLGERWRHWLRCPWCAGTWWVAVVVLAVELIEDPTTPWWLYGPAAAAVLGLAGQWWEPGDIEEV